MGGDEAALVDPVGLWGLGRRWEFWSLEAFFLRGAVSGVRRRGREAGPVKQGYPGRLW